MTIVSMPKYRLRDSILLPISQNKDTTNKLISNKIRQKLSRLGSIKLRDDRRYYVIPTAEL